MMFCRGSSFRSACCLPAQRALVATHVHVRALGFHALLSRRTLSRCPDAVYRYPGDRRGTFTMACIGVQGACLWAGNSVGLQNAASARPCRRHSKPAATVVAKHYIHQLYSGTVCGPWLSILKKSAVSRRRLYAARAAQYHACLLYTSPSPRD